MSRKKPQEKQVQKPEPKVPAAALPERRPGALDAPLTRLAQRPRGGGPRLNPAQVLALQRSLGNRAVIRRLRAMTLKRPARRTAAGGGTAGREEPIQRQPPRPGAAGATQRQDVVVIVGRPSQTIERKETAQQKQEMAAWRAAAAALSSTVFEGLTVSKAFAGLRRLRKPIGKLYIIGHASEAGFVEIAANGTVIARSKTADLARRIKRAAGRLGKRAPQSIEILSCYGGGSPKSMGQIGGALGAPTVRAPLKTANITGARFNVGGKWLTRARMRRLSNATLSSYIQQGGALANYDFVPGVPHPQPAPSRADKLKNLVAVLRKTGQIPFVAFNAEAGQRGAVPYWKAGVERLSATRKDLTALEIAKLHQRSKSVIEVSVTP